MVNISVSSRWLAPILIAVASLALAGGLLARDYYQQESAAAAGPVSLPTTTSLSPAQQPGSPLVKLSPDAAQHPHDETVRRLLQAYFDGINGRNYERWKTSVTSERVRAKTQQQWQRDYRSTQDGSILVHRIETAHDETMRVLLSFTSTQAIRDAPVTLPHRCIHWWLALPIALEQGHWKIDTVPPGTVPEMAPC